MILFDKLKLGYGSRVLIEEFSSHIESGTRMVSIFGRSTPVELEFWQVGPDEE